MEHEIDTLTDERDLLKVQDKVKYQKWLREKQPSEPKIVGKAVKYLRKEDGGEERRQKSIQQIITQRETNREISNREAQRRIYEENRDNEGVEEEIKDGENEDKKSTNRKNNYSRWQMNRSSSPCIINQENKQPSEYQQRHCESEDYNQHLLKSIQKMAAATKVGKTARSINKTQPKTNQG